LIVLILKIYGEFMNKLTIENLIATLKTLSPEEFLPHKDEWKNLKYLIESKNNELTRWQAAQDYARLQVLIKETSFAEPSYESFDEEEEESQLPLEGYASFASKDQADELIKLLNKDYYYLYKIDWQGPGDYKITSSSDYKCGDVLYTAHFSKK
jgi:hypothetical protein